MRYGRDCGLWLTRCRFVFAEAATLHMLAVRPGKFPSFNRLYKRLSPNLRRARSVWPLTVRSGTQRQWNNFADSQSGDQSPAYFLMGNSRLISCFPRGIPKKPSEFRDRVLLLCRSSCFSCAARLSPVRRVEAHGSRPCSLIVSTRARHQSRQSGSFAR